MRLTNEPLSNNVLVQVNLVMPEGSKTLLCPVDVYILDQAEQDGIDLPYSCRAGSCGACVGKIISGSVEQKAQTFLTNEQVQAGFVCLCVAYPETAITIETHKESDLS